MSNDLTPTPPDPLDGFIQKLNLPEMIAGPAGKAISRLVAGVVEIPAAFLDRFAQGLKDKTVAKTTVNQAVAEAAAKWAASDDDIVARAAHNLLAKEYRHQRNKESIARKTIDILRAESAPQASDGDNTAPQPDVDVDWLNVFERYAGDASSEKAQDLWSKVLAGEIRRPASFSLATLRFLAELDGETAALFEKFAGRVFNDNFIAFPRSEGQEFSELVQLESSGIVYGVDGSVSKSLKFSQPLLTTAIMYVNSVILITAIPSEMVIRSVLLTRIGRELLPMTKRGVDLGVVESFAESLRGLHAKSIKSVELIVPGGERKTIWRSVEGS